MSQEKQFNGTISDQVRVLIVENEPEDRNIYVDLLTLWGYQPYSVETERMKLLSQAKELARSFRCHLALIDLRLMDDNDPDDLTGLELARCIKPTEAIIISGYLNHQIARIIKDNGVFSFVGKEESPESLEAELEKAAQKFCACWRGLEVQPLELIRGFAGDFYRDSQDMPEDEVADVLARLFPDAKKLRIELIEGSGHRSFTDVPRPRSKVLLAHQDDLQPQVVKLARAKKIAEEVRRYGTCIEGRLVGHFSLPIKDQAILWDIGGTVYPFLGASTIEPFSAYYEKAGTDDIQYSLDQFFNHTWSDLYRAARQKPPGRNYVFDAYYDVWGPEWYEERVMNFTYEEPPLKMLSQWQALQAPDPISWLKEWVARKSEMPLTSLAITHGDLHGDNMLVDEHRHIWAIDFERSGPGPILQDFVELEVDIITRLAGLPEDDFMSLYTLGVWLARSKNFHELPDLPADVAPHMKKTMQVITCLRRLAGECSGETDARQYLWGMICNVLFRATLLPPKKQRSQHRALMLGSIFCHRLDRWDEPWPPDD